MAKSMLVATAGQQHFKNKIWAICCACAIEAHLHVYQLSKCGTSMIDLAAPVLSSHAVLLGLRHRRDVSIAEFTALPLKKAVLV